MYEVHEGRFLCPGVTVGHADDPRALTGCSVVVLPRASRYAVHVGGGASSTRQVSGLVPGHSVAVADAFVVAGGSAFGLDAAGGVLRWLEARGRGLAVGAMRVPAAPAVAVFDLNVGDGSVRPDGAMGWRACEAAAVDPVPEGRVGAGAGATTAKALGVDHARWGGTAVASMDLGGGLWVSVLAVVNAFGEVRDPATGQAVAQVRDGLGGTVDTEDLILSGALAARQAALHHTTIGVVVTNGTLARSQCGRAATLAAAAFPACIHPCWTALDGDTVFVAATGEVPAEAHQVGVAARRCLERAIVRGVRLANPPDAVPPEQGGPG